MNYGTYRTEHQRYMLDKVTNNTVLVAKFAGVDEILGYAITGGGVILHYVYVKQPYRRQHIATALARGCTTYTTYTKTGQKFAESLKLVYNPYL